MIRRSPALSCPSRVWKMALCSLSTGRITAPRRSRLLHHQLPGHHQGFLVGQGHRLPGTDRRQGRFKSRRRRPWPKPRWRLPPWRQWPPNLQGPQKALGLAANPAVSQRGGTGLVGHRHPAGMEFGYLRLQQRNISPGRQSDDPKALRKPANQLQYLGADGTGAAEDGQGLGSVVMK